MKSNGFRGKKRINRLLEKGFFQGTPKYSQIGHYEIARAGLLGILKREGFEWSRNQEE